MRRPKPIPNCRRVWHRLWSVRLSILSSLLSAMEFAIPYIAPSVPSGRFAAAAFVVALAATAARLVVQEKLHGDKN